MRSLLHHFATAGLLAAGAVLGGGLIGYPAVAFAELDIGKYDACIEANDREFGNWEISYDTWVNNYERCCVGSGGVMKGRGVTGTCYAPPADSATVEPPSRPLPNSTATATLEPAPGNPLGGNALAR
jgi:hypothetical protein